jgi:hypothetical protein
MIYDMLSVMQIYNFKTLFCEWKINLKTANIGQQTLFIQQKMEESLPLHKELNNKILEGN